MENQQSFFIDPREQPEEREKIFETEPLPRFVNQDPREQSAYRTGYEGPYDGPAYRQTLGEKIFPRRVRRRAISWPLFILIAIFILALSGFMTARYDRPWSRGYHDSSMFTVVDNAKLIINDNNGHVYVHTGDDQHISVTTVIRTSRRDGRLLPSTDARLIDSHTVAVDANNPHGDAGAATSPVDLDITVPETASLAIHMTGGVVSVEDVKGNIQVDATHSNIELDSTEGQVELTTSTGNIELSDVQLSGSSSLKASNGNINFAGSLDPYGNYDFETASGSTDITLPDSSAFHLTTFSNNSVENEFHSTSVGDGQQAGLTVHAGNGYIAIHQED